MNNAVQPGERLSDPTHLQGLNSVCLGQHEELQGICVRCGAWLPRAECRDSGCGWASAPGEDALYAAVRHRDGEGHPVRVVVG